VIFYAGVQLPSPTLAQIAWVQAHVPFDWSAEFLSRGQPSTRLTTVKIQGYQDTVRTQFAPPHYWPRGPVRAGVLCWPTWGASRFATAHYLCNETALAAIHGAGGGMDFLPLLLDDGTSSIQTNMWLLPARPLSLAAREDEVAEKLYLLTLVDNRFFWWFRPGVFTGDPLAASVSQLYDAIALALGIEIAYPMDTSRFVRLDPSLSVWDYQPLPLILDQVAATVMHRIVCGLDGSVTAVNVDGAQALYTPNLDLTTPRIAGGQFALTP
jgi:hypothetical protein